VAGYVDAMAFVKLGGFFVSFMSGNSTRLGVGLADLSENAMIAGGLVACFVSGGVLGSLTGHFAKARRLTAVLGLVASLLAAASILDALGETTMAVVLMAAAMGAENAALAQDGEVKVGLTYMTGTLVRVGQRLSDALLGGRAFGWAPDLALWAGLVAGAVLGAMVFRAVGLVGLWLPVIILAGLAVLSSRAANDETTGA
jgi:uncharacterized membrane protein YoaK (UPF0700 family)